MDSPMIRAAWQTAALSATSNVLGQAITCYQANKPFTLNTTDLAYFVLFSVLCLPPNFAWQAWLEKQFPGYTPPGGDKDESQHRDSDITNDKAGTSDTAYVSKGGKKLNLRNTAIKFGLDQTIGAAVNTILFLVGMDLLKGQPVHVAMRDCRERFWPLIFAGQKLWPAVSIISFLVVPVEHRTTFGSVVGLFWGIYLSLLSSSTT